MTKLIVEMEMPQACPCEFADSSSGIFTPCFAYYGVVERAAEFDKCVKSGKRPDWCPIKGVLPDGHGDLVDYDEVEKEFNRLLTYMEEVPDENGVIWFKRETIMPRGYTMKFHTIIPAERRKDE
jgi:hypothetical protein